MKYMLHGAVDSKDRMAVLCVRQTTCDPKNQAVAAHPTQCTCPVTHAPPGLPLLLLLQVRWGRQPATPRTSDGGSPPPTAPARLQPAHHYFCCAAGAVEQTTCDPKNQRWCRRGVWSYARDDGPVLLPFTSSSVMNQWAQIYAAMSEDVRCVCCCAFIVCACVCCCPSPSQPVKNR